MLTAELAEQAPRLPATLCLDPGTVNTKMLLAGWGRCGIEVCGALLMLSVFETVAACRLELLLYACAHTTRAIVFCFYTKSMCCLFRA